MKYTIETTLLAKYGLSFDLCGDDARDLLDLRVGVEKHIALVNKWIAPAMRDKFIIDIGDIEVKLRKIYDTADLLKTHLEAIGIKADVHEYLWDLDLV